MRVTSLKGWKAAAAGVALGGVVGATLLAAAVPGCETNELWGPGRESWAEASRLRADEELWRLHAAIVTLRDADAAAALESLCGLVADSPGLPPAVQRLAIALRDAGDLEGSL